MLTPWLLLILVIASSNFFPGYIYLYNLQFSNSDTHASSEMFLYLFSWAVVF